MAIRLGDIELNGYLGDVEIGYGYLGDVLIFSPDSGVTVDGMSRNLSSQQYKFTLADFTTNFTTQEGTTHDEVVLTSIPLTGGLAYLSAEVTSGAFFKTTNSNGLVFTLPPRYAVYAGALYEFEKSVIDIYNEFHALGYKITSNIAGKLTFTHNNDVTDIIEIQGMLVDNSQLSFTFMVIDDLGQGSENATFTFIPQGDVNVISNNKLPVVGDANVEAVRLNPKQLQRQHFTNTIPQFSDEDGDQPYELWVKSIPLDGMLTLRGTIVKKDDILSFVDDIDSGDFYYIPNQNSTTQYVEFEFDISDTGTKRFGSNG